MRRRGFLGLLAACVFPWRKVRPAKVLTEQGLLNLIDYARLRRRFEMLEYQQEILRRLDEGRRLTVMWSPRHGKSWIGPLVRARLEE